MNTRAIKQLLEAMEQGGYRHLDLQIGAERIKLVRDRCATTANDVETAVAGETSAQIDEKVGLIQVLSDRVGVYTGGKAPVQIETAVKKGQSLGIIKGISIQDTVTAPVAGVIKEMFVKEGDLVEFGRRLFAIEPA